MICKKCSTPLEKNDTFCQACGEPAPPKGKGNKVKWVVGGMAGGVILIIALVVGIMLIEIFSENKQIATAVFNTLKQANAEVSVLLEHNENQEYLLTENLNSSLVFNSETTVKEIGGEVGQQFNFLKNVSYTIDGQYDVINSTMLATLNLNVKNKSVLDGSFLMKDGNSFVSSNKLTNGKNYKLSQENSSETEIDENSSMVTSIILGLSLASKDPDFANQTKKFIMNSNTKTATYGRDFTLSSTEKISCDDFQVDMPTQYIKEYFEYINKVIIDNYGESSSIQPFINRLEQDLGGNVYLNFGIANDKVYYCGLIYKKNDINIEHYLYFENDKDLVLDKVIYNKREDTKRTLGMEFKLTATSPKDYNVFFMAFSPSLKDDRYDNYSSYAIDVLEDKISFEGKMYGDSSAQNLVAEGTISLDKENKIATVEFPSMEITTISALGEFILKTENISTVNFTKEQNEIAMPEDVVDWATLTEEEQLKETAVIMKNLENFMISLVLNSYF